MTQILDQFGRPIERKTLDEPQSAKVWGLHREFATHPSRGLTPAKLARILEAAEQGDLVSQAELFEDMEEKDGHIFAELSKRKRAPLTLEWDIKPPRGASAAEEKAAALAKELIQDLPDFEDLLLDLLDAVGKAYSCVELEWGRLGSTWLPQALHHRPQSWFTVPQEDRNELRLRDASMDGMPLEPFGWIVHVHKAKSGYLSRAGLSRVLAWPYLFKNYSVRDLAEFLEIYGLPLRLGTYPSGATDQDKTTLLNAVVNIGHRAAGIVPEGMAIDFKEAAKGTSMPFKAMIDWCEATQSKAILGGTLTSQTSSSGGGAYALGEVHNEVRHDLLVSDVRQLAGTLTRDLVYPLLALNTAGIDGLRRCPRFAFETKQPADIQSLSSAVPPLVNVGVRIPESWVRDKLGIPEAGEQDAVLSPTAPQAPAAALRHGHGCPHCAAAALKGGPGGSTLIDDYVEQMEREAGPAVDAMIDRIREVVMSSSSFEEVQDRLLEAYASLAPDELARVMQLGFAAADLAGRFEVREGR